MWISSSRGVRRFSGLGWICRQRRRATGPTCWSGSCRTRSACGARENLSRCRRRRSRRRLPHTGSWPPTRWCRCGETTTRCPPNWLARKCRSRTAAAATASRSAAPSAPWSHTAWRREAKHRTVRLREYVQAPHNVVLAAFTCEGPYRSKLNRPPGTEGHSDPWPACPPVRRSHRRH